MIVIGVKFCGGCNPLIDRGKLFKMLVKELPPEFELRLDFSKPWDIGIMINGCPNACSDDVELRKLAPRWIIVSGAMLDYLTVDESDLVGAIIRKIQDMAVEKSSVAQNASQTWSMKV